MLDVCRICLGNESVKHFIFDNKNELLSNIMSYLPINVSPMDTLPKKICDKCSFKILDFHDFCKKAMEAEKKLLLRQLEFPGADPFAYKEEEKPSLIGEVTIEGQIGIQEAILNIKKETVYHGDIESVTISNHFGMTPSSSNEKSTLRTRPSKMDIIITGNKKASSQVQIKEEFSSDHNDNEFNISVNALEFDSDDDWKPEEIIEEVPITIINKTPKTNRLFIVNKDVSLKKVKRRKRRTKAEIVEEQNDELPLIKWKEVVVKPKRMRRRTVGSPKKNWQCLTCFKTMKNKIELVEHYNEHAHAMKDLDITNDNHEPEFEMLNPPDVETQCYKCLTCAKTVDSIRKIRLHMTSHVKGRYFVCNVCTPPRDYKHVRKLILHEAMHAGERARLHCDIDNCSYSTVHSSCLSIHRIKIHTKNYKHKCKICNKGFHTLTNFEDHMNKHNGLFPYTCDYCDKKFFSRTNKLLHRNTMHPEKSAKPIRPCPECDEICTTAKKLRQHMEKAHGTYCTRRICDWCGKEFSSSDHLKIHLRIHTGEKPFSCTFCNKSFTRKCTLVEHIRIHTGERPYSCSFCKKGFTQRTARTIHERTHTGDKPYVCKNCTKGFASQGLLTTHLKSCAPHNITAAIMPPPKKRKPTTSDKEHKNFRKKSWSDTDTDSESYNVGYSDECSN